MPHGFAELNTFSHFHVAAERRQHSVKNSTSNSISFQGRLRLGVARESLFYIIYESATEHIKEIERNN